MPEPDIRLLPEPFCSQAMNNRVMQYGVSSTRPYALSQSFTWSMSVEGGNYWDTINSFYEDHPYTDMPSVDARGNLITRTTTVERTRRGIIDEPLFNAPAFTPKKKLTPQQKAVQEFADELSVKIVFI